MGQTILTDIQKRALQVIASDKTVDKLFYLTGGTALSAYYLHHRVSEDLDFFSETAIDPLWVNVIAKYIKSAIGADVVDVQRSYNRNLIFFHIGTYVLKTEFTYFPFTQIDPTKTADNLHIDSLLDIAVNKFFTIYQQPASRHFIDLYCILRTSNILWEHLAKLARIKFDTVIDPLQLGSRLITAKTAGQLPQMLLPLKESEWRNYFLEKARGLKKQIGR